MTARRVSKAQVERECGHRGIEGAAARRARCPVLIDEGDHLILESR
jgi:hypothetical protein